jgi:hypothetical protein
LLPVHGHNNALSNDDFDFIYFDDSHEDTMDVINDEQYILFLKGQPTMVRILSTNALNFLFGKKILIKS